MSVRKHDAADWRPKTWSRSKYAGRRSCKPGINESETIVFRDQEAIDHAETSQTDKIPGFLNKAHMIPCET
jgi:hypothetical protein